MALYPASGFTGFSASYAVPSDVSGDIYWFGRYHFIDRVDPTSI